MQRLFYDTETTGFPDYHRPSDAAHQPHIVQLTALLTDYYGAKLSSLDVLIRPDGWTIDETGDAFKSNGITNALATAGGMPEFEAVALFMRLIDCADLRIAHNDAFDARIIRIALKRMGRTDAMAAWKDMDKFCTMHGSTKHAKMPPTPKMLAANRKHFKNPSLGESYQHFFGEELKNAHNAMFDVMACKRVYFAILEAEGKGVERRPDSLTPQEPAPEAGPDVQRAAKPEPRAPRPDPDDQIDDLI